MKDSRLSAYLSYIGILSALRRSQNTSFTTITTYPTNALVRRKIGKRTLTVCRGFGFKVSEKDARVQADGESRREECGD